MGTLSEVLLVRLNLNHRYVMSDSVTHVAVTYAFDLPISSTSVIVFPAEYERHFHLPLCVCHATFKIAFPKLVVIELRMFVIRLLKCLKSSLK